MAVGWIHTEGLDVVRVRPGLRRVISFRHANGRDTLRMAEKDPPGAAEPFMEMHRAGAFWREFGRGL